jgi:hypothetical protein
MSLSSSYFFPFQSFKPRCKLKTNLVQMSYLSFTCTDRGIPYIVKPVVRGHLWDKEKVTTWAGLTVLLI